MVIYPCSTDMLFAPVLPHHCVSIFSSIIFFSFCSSIHVVSSDDLQAYSFNGKSPNHLTCVWSHFPHCNFTLLSHTVKILSKFITLIKICIWCCPSIKLPKIPLLSTHPLSLPLHISAQNTEQGIKEWQKMWKNIHQYKICPSKIWPNMQHSIQYFQRAETLSHASLPNSLISVETIDM